MMQIPPIYYESVFFEVTLPSMMASSHCMLKNGRGKGDGAEHFGHGPSQVKCGVFSRIRAYTESKSSVVLFLGKVFLSSLYMLENAEGNGRLQASVAPSRKGPRSSVKPKESIILRLLSECVFSVCR